MNSPANSSLLLPHLGVIAVRGTDARKFLDGQLSQDVLGLTPDRVELAGLHNPQGRTIAIVRLIPFGPSDVLLVMPRDLIADTVAGLRKYLLRAKATIVDESSNWRIEGLTDDTTLPAPMGRARIESDRLMWRHAGDGRVIRLTPQTPRDSDSVDETINSGDRARLQAWHLADIVAGLPELTSETRGEFVAQMLNLDALGGISFTKGCYTGQEVIARAHYRGRVKRRVQRFRLDSSMPIRTPLQPGMKVQLTAEGWTRAAQIVKVAEHEGVVEFLAVTGFGGAASETTEPGATGPGPTGLGATESGTIDSGAAAASTTAAIKAQSQPMSYALPE